MDSSTFAVELGRQALLQSLVISAPILAAGLVVGLAISILQAVTQVHEMTLSFVPKIVAMTLVTLFFLPWMLNRLIDYTQALLWQLPEMTR